MAQNVFAPIGTGPPPSVLGRPAPSLKAADMEAPCDDPQDPLGYAKRFGVSAEQILEIDRETRMSRFNPTENMLDRLDFINARLCNENRLGAKGIAKLFYSHGARSIWVLASGRFFYGPEAAYLERMGVKSVDEAIARIKGA